MKLRLIIPIFIAVLIFSCKDDGIELPKEVEEEIDEDYFLAFNSNQPSSHMLFDTLNDLIYIFDNDDGRITAYDYNNYEIVAETSIEGFYFENNVAIGNYNNQTEVYVSSGQKIFIHDGNTLTLKDSIIITEFNNIRFVASLEFQAPDLLFIGADSG